MAFEIGSQSQQISWFNNNSSKEVGFEDIKSGWEVSVFENNDTDNLMAEDIYNDNPEAYGTDKYSPDGLIPINDASIQAEVLNKHIFERQNTTLAEQGFQMGISSNEDGTPFFYRVNENGDTEYLRVSKSQSEFEELNIIKTIVPAGETDGQTTIYGVDDVYGRYIDEA